MDDERILAELSNEELLRGLVESGDNIFAVVDTCGRFLYCSAPEQYGISASDVVGKVYADFWPSGITAMYRRHLKEVLDAGKSITTEDHVVWQGQDLWFFNHKYPIRDHQGEIIAIGSVSRNVTERKRAEKAIVHNQRLLLALSRAAEGLHRARTPDAVYQAIGEQVSALSLEATVFTLNEAQTHLTASYLTLKSDLLQTAAELTGIAKTEYGFPLKPGGVFRQIITSGEAVFSRQVTLPFAETMPQHVHPLIQRLINLFGQQQSIVAPLVEDDEIWGFLAITGADLIETDVSAVTAFANQTATALENARLYKETRHLATFNQQIIQEVTEGIVVEDREGIFTFANPAAAEILGYMPSELVGMHWMAITPPHQRAAVDAANGRRARGEADRYELELVKKDGQPIFAMVSGTPHFDTEGNFAGTMSVFTDITARKQTEEEVKFQAMVLNQIQNSVVVADLEGTILYVNAEAMRNQKREQKELVGKPVDVYGEDPSRGATQQQIMENTLQNGGWHGEIVNYAADGTEVVMDLRTTLIRDDRGEPWRIVGIGTDITARKRMEEQLRAALQEKEAMMMEIHHRVRNSLQVIINLLTFQANHTQDDVTLAVLGDSRRRVKTMAMIHEQLYQVANFSEVDLAEYIPTLATNLLAAYRANLGPVELTLDLHETVLDVKQAVPCGLIISELVSNALRHAFPTVQAWPDDFAGEIRIALHSVGDKCVLSVSDNGMGLSTGFDVPDESTLGIFLIKSFAEQLNATVSWESWENVADSAYPGTLCRIEFVCR